jgi:integrase
MHGTIRRGKDGTWIADVRVNGVRRQLKATTRQEAEQRFHKAVHELLEGTETKGSRSAPLEPRPASFTIRQAMELSCSVRWAGPYRKTAELRALELVKWFGEDFPLEDITPSVVQEYREHLKHRGNKVTTINRKICVLRALVEDATEHQMIKVVPAIPRGFPIPKSNKRAFTSDEITLFCQAFKRRGWPKIADVFIFLLDTCSRWGEVEKLCGESVNLENRTVTFWDTKNGETRTVPLTARSLEIARKYMTGDLAGRLFGVKYSYMRYCFDIAKADVGLAHDKRVTIHCTRHTAATQMTISGVPQLKAMAYGGWTDPKSFKRYNHLQTNDLQDCARLMEGIATDALSAAEGAS